MSDKKPTLASARRRLRQAAQKYTHALDLFNDDPSFGDVHVALADEELEQAARELAALTPRPGGAK